MSSLTAAQCIAKSEAYAEQAAAALEVAGYSRAQTLVELSRAYSVLAQAKVALSGWSTRSDQLSQVIDHIRSLAAK